MPGTLLLLLLLLLPLLLYLVEIAYTIRTYDMIRVPCIYASTAVFVYLKFGVVRRGGDANRSIYIHTYSYNMYDSVRELKCKKDRFGIISF